ncbi:conserved hypothetical protein [Candidatus Desulfarcum epimagneticum]|uniref:TGS domain-containing protein n=1 Tax=uncultured Desulfobacteraceae bacterium TaxID=218296 RepID=A0A484HP36_9BACT|nr:conserved hypothetical protein [uncultured Desulfobacteraceae bacterium]
MKLGLIGLPGSGKSTLFEALTGRAPEARLRGEDSLAAVKAPDSRVDALSRIYEPEKTIYARVNYMLPGKSQGAADASKTADLMAGIRDCDALIHVIRNHGGFGFEPPGPAADFAECDQELALADLIVAEKRMERLALDRKRGKPVNEIERSLLEKSLVLLEKGLPLRRDPGIALAKELRGFAFLSAKPMLALFNNEDGDPDSPDMGGDFQEESVAISGKLEQELAQMSDEDARDFLKEFDISETARDRVIELSYRLLGLISFFTVGKDEVRAWTVKDGDSALEAAGAIHTDIQKGFIRAEVLSCDDLMEAGSYAEAQKKGKTRLEGKTYIVKDGDIVHFRFNV